MKPVKFDQNKAKSRSKLPCSSKQSSQFIEKECLNGTSLSFSTISTNFCDFIPNDQDVLVHDIDFEIAKNLKKLEKKDPITKQKSLNDLLDIIFPSKPESAIISSLKFWPKLYQKLSVDDDKKVRELSQRLMGQYANICGRQLSSCIKQILPAWILSQSDLHYPAANIAKQSFLKTFPNEDKQRAAYMLCWRTIFGMLCSSLTKTPLLVRENTNEGDSDKPEEEQYIGEIVAGVRTLMTLIPHVVNSGDSDARENLMKLLEKASFWQHSLQKGAPDSVRSVYLDLGSILLQHLLNNVQESTFLVARVTDCLRWLVDRESRYGLVDRVARASVECCELLPADILWKTINFRSTFLPGLIRLLESGVNSCAAEFAPRALPLVMRLPLLPNQYPSYESISIGDGLEPLLHAMIVCCDTARVVNVEYEANSAFQMLLDCTLYSIIKVFSCDRLASDRIIDLVIKAVEKRLTDQKFKKFSQIVTDFIQRFIKFLVTAHKGQLYPASKFIDLMISWIDEYDDNNFFCMNLTGLLVESEKINEIKDQHFLTNLIAPVLRRKVLFEERNGFLIPYLQTNLSQDFDSSAVDDSILDRLSILMKDSNLAMNESEIVCRGLATLISGTECSKSIDNISIRFNRFISSLSPNEMVFFYSRFYKQFVTHFGDQNALFIVSDISTNLWIDIINKIVEQIASDEPQQQKSPQLSLAQIFDLSLALNHQSQLLVSCLDTCVSNCLSKPLSVDSIDRLSELISHQCIDKINKFHNLLIIPRSLLNNLLKLIICSNNIEGSYLESILVYLTKQVKSCDKQSQQLSASAHEPSEKKEEEDHQESEIVDWIDIYKDLLSEAMLNIDSSSNLEVISLTIIKRIIESAPESSTPYMVENINQDLKRAVLAVETVADAQKHYSAMLSHNHHQLVAKAVQSICMVHYLVRNCPRCLDLEKVLVEAAMLISPMMSRIFSSCQNSNGLLEQCQLVHQSVVEPLTMFDKVLVVALSTNASEESRLFHQCPTLVHLSLRHFASDNYSQWTPFFRSMVDSAVSDWSNNDSNLSLICRVFLPSAVTARYLVQEMVVATIASYLCPSRQPTLPNINRALAIMANISSVNSSYFHAFFPILVSVRPLFDPYIDDLYPAELNRFEKTDGFDLTSLLEFIWWGLESRSIFDQNQWEFIFCIIDSLIRSEGFANSGNYRLASIISGRDHLVNPVWLLKIISSVAVALVSITNDMILDEWDNLFSQSIFTAILDQFSLVSGEYQDGKLVHSDYFTFYLEALSDAVSVCPVNILLNHEFASKISINDPVDWPKNFLMVFNFMLESLSSYWLSVQLASYNCLLNMSDNLSEILLDQINTSEKTETLDKFSINFPHKLLTYLTIEDFDQLNIDKIENQIILIRSFLSWNIVLHLFSTAQPKLRAEIGIFLTQNDRCFDKFLNFCFTFMPKNPVINKKHLSFIEKNNSCNLISEEPFIFAQCVEKRSKFIIYHLSAYIFRRSMQILPTLCRAWWMSLDMNSQQLVDGYVRQFLTRELFKIEFNQLKEIVDKEFDDKLEIKAIPMIGEVTVKYNVTFDQSLELLIKLPNNYPIGNIQTEFKKEMTVKISHWKNWIGQMTMTLENQNGSIFDGVKLWKKNLDNYFNGIEECMICYSIIHATRYTLPTMPCYQCKKKFHKDCMYKWFHSSTNPTCPNCRNIFYDGSQKNK